MKYGPYIWKFVDNLPTPREQLSITIAWKLDQVSQGG